MQTAVPSTTAPASYTTPDTVPAHALAWGRRVVSGARFLNRRDLVRAVICAAAAVRARRLDPVELQRAVCLGRALWREGEASPRGGRVFPLVGVVA